MSAVDSHVRADIHLASSSLATKAHMQAFVRVDASKRTNLKYVGFLSCTTNNNTAEVLMTYAMMQFQSYSHPLRSLRFYRAAWNAGNK